MGFCRRGAKAKTRPQLLGVTLPERVITAQTVVIRHGGSDDGAASALWQKGAQLLKVKLTTGLSAKAVNRHSPRRRRPR